MTGSTQEGHPVWAVVYRAVEWRVEMLDITNELSALHASEPTFTTDGPRNGRMKEFFEMGDPIETPSIPAPKLVTPPDES